MLKLRLIYNTVFFLIVLHILDMAIVRVILIAGVLTLLKCNTLACDNECDIISVPEDNTNLTLVGEPHGRETDIWIKPGETFEKIVFKLKVDKTFDFFGDVIHEHNLEINDTELSEAIPKNKLADWNKINVSVIDVHVTFWPDHFNISAEIEENIFMTDTRLFPLTSEMKAIQVWVQGECELSINCHPCNENQKLNNSNPLLETSVSINIPITTTPVDESTTTESLNTTITSDWETPSINEQNTKQKAGPLSLTDDTEPESYNTTNYQGVKSIFTESEIQDNSTESISTNATSGYVNIDNSSSINHGLQRFLSHFSITSLKVIDDLSSLISINEDLTFDDVDDNTNDYLEDESILDLLNKVSRTSGDSNIFESLMNSDSDGDSISRAREMQRLFEQYSRLQRLMKSSNSQKDTKKTKKTEKIDEKKSDSSEKMQLLIFVLIGISGFLLFFLVVVVVVLIGLKMSKSSNKKLLPEFAYLSEKQTKEDNIYDEVRSPNFFKGSVINGYTNLGDKKVILNEKLHPCPENSMKQHPISKNQGLESNGICKVNDKCSQQKTGDKLSSGVERNEPSCCSSSDSATSDSPSLLTESASPPSVLEIVNEKTSNAKYIPKKDSPSGNTVLNNSENGKAIDNGNSSNL